MLGGPGNLPDSLRIADGRDDLFGGGGHWKRKAGA